MTTIGKLILSYYVISSLILLSNFKSNFSKQGWSNDVVLNPNEVKLEPENFRIAIRMNIYSNLTPFGDFESHGSLDLSRNFRPLFNQHAYYAETQVSDC